MSRLRRLPSIAAAPVLVCLLGMAFTTAAAAWVYVEARTLREEQFERLASRAELAVSTRLETYVALLRGGAGLFSARTTVTADEFARYAARLNLAERYPGVQGIAYAEALGVERPPYSTIRFIHPLDERNRAAVGFDMYAEPTRRAAMAQARDTGLPAASARVTLVQEIYARKQPGFLVYVPVYEGGEIPPTVAERRARLRGWSCAAFRADDFLRATFAGTDLLHRLDVQVLDSQGARLFPAEPGAGRPRERAVERPFKAAGREWRLLLAPKSHLRSRHPALEALPVVVLGLLTTLLLTGASSMQQRALRKARKAEVRAREARAQSELLLGEVNHRVANSLQLVNSLVAMQAAAVSEPAARRALADTQARILAIARVHHRLYTGTDAICVELKGYLENLVGELGASLGADERRPVTLHAAEAEVSTDKAVAVGVVVAELVTNAFKYAYGPAERGEIRVRLENAAGALTLAVEDDGVGLGAPHPHQGTGPSAGKGTGMGMKVIRAMAATLNAQLDAAPRSRGARVTLTFAEGC